MKKVSSSDETASAAKTVSIVNVSQSLAGCFVPARFVASFEHGVPL